jgi:hypothetical protein
VRVAQGKYFQRIYKTVLPFTMASIETAGVAELQICISHSRSSALYLSHEGCRHNTPISTATPMQFLSMYFFNLLFCVSQYNNYEHPKGPFCFGI